MKITEIAFDVLRNIGNFENVRYSVTVALDEGEKPDFEPLKKAIYRQHAKLYPPTTNEKFKNTSRADKVLKPNK